MHVYKEQVLKISNITKIFEIAKTSFTSIKHHKGFDISKNQHMYIINSPTIYACVNES